jgi:tetratricopeptide (TPR) repeat protein
LVGATRLAGRLIALLTSTFVLNVLLLTGVIAILAALDNWCGVIETWLNTNTWLNLKWCKKAETAETWLTASRVLGIWALVWIVWWVLHQRRRLLVAHFDNLGGDKDAGAGMSVLLANELAELGALFQGLEEGYAIKALGPGQTEVAIDTNTSFLESAVSAESTLTVGPLKIPIAVLLGLVNRLVQGPRISGQIQNDGGRRIVTIDLKGGRFYHQFRIEDGPNAHPRSSADLARELAIQIFATGAFATPPVRGIALKFLIEGLRAYQRTTWTTKDVKLTLLAAERHFLDTITEDFRSDLAFYNLGFVYTNLGVRYEDLDRLRAARTAFADAIERNPQRFDSQYALAWLLGYTAKGKDTEAARTDLRVALDHCDRALILASDAEARAKALNLKALVGRELGGWDYSLAAAHCRAAVRSALLSLLGAELVWFRRPELAKRQRDLAQLLASSSLKQLGSILRSAQVQRGMPRWQRLLGRWRRLRAARLASLLSPDEVDGHLALGVYWLERERPRRAINPLNRAAQIAPERGDAWGSMALANAKLFREDEVDAAYAKAMNALWANSDGFLPDLARAFSTLAAGWRYVRMETRRIARQAKARGRLGAALSARTYLLSGRRLRPLYRLAVQLPQREEQIKYLDAKINRRRAEASRIRRLSQRRAEVKALSEDANDRSGDLEVHYQEAIDHEWNWEAGNAAWAMGRVAMRFKRPADARQWFEKAIEVFKPRDPARLHTHHADSLSQLRDHGAALDAARRAVKIDPVDGFERFHLAGCHFDLKEWGGARREWQESLRFLPDNPNAYHNIALCCSNEASSADNATERRAFLTEAETNLDRALRLFATEDPQRLHSQFLLGRIKVTLGNVREGEALWHALESRGYLPLYLGLSLAFIGLRERSLDQAQAEFERWARHVADKIKESPEIMHQPIDGLPGDPEKTTYIEALMWTELGMATAIARREGGFDDALMHVGKARAAAAEINDEATRLKSLGFSDLCEGEVLLRKGEAAKAAPLFQSALLKTTDKDSYRYLAQALLDQLDPSAADANARSTAMRIKSLLEHAVKLDLDEEIKQPIAELRSRLGSTAAGKAIAWTVA